MYLFVSIYVYMSNLYICIYRCNVYCEASIQTNLLLLSLLLGGPNLFGGGRATNPEPEIIYRPVLLKLDVFLLITRCRVLALLWVRRLGHRGIEHFCIEDVESGIILILPLKFRKWGAT